MAKTNIWSVEVCKGQSSRSGIGAIYASGRRSEEVDVKSWKWGISLVIFSAKGQKNSDALQLHSIPPGDAGPNNPAPNLQHKGLAGIRLFVVTKGKTEKFTI